MISAIVCLLTRVMSGASVSTKLWSAGYMPDDAHNQSGRPVDRQHIDTRPVRAAAAAAAAARTQYQHQQTANSERITYPSSGEICLPTRSLQHPNLL
jgi:hypothetical protein